MGDEIHIDFRNPVSMQARQADRAADGLLVAQIADAITTRMWLARPSTFERDPIMRGAVRSDDGAIGSVLALKFLARVAFRRNPGTLHALTIIEDAMVVNNLRALNR